MILKTKIRILSVGRVLSQLQTNKPEKRSVDIVVQEVPELNPYGHDHKNAVPFIVEVHNTNIEKFSINQNLVGEFAHAEFVIVPYKKDAETPTIHRFFLNDLIMML